jgi:hypothetical protein
VTVVVAVLQPFIGTYVVLLGLVSLVYGNGKPSSFGTRPAVLMPAGNVAAAFVVQLSGSLVQIRPRVMVYWAKAPWSGVRGHISFCAQ